MRITKKVFTDLAVWMISFGILIGIIFPFFVIVMGVPSKLALSPVFFLSCISAGFLVGAINISLARIVVGLRLKHLTERMQNVENHIKKIIHGEDTTDCNPENCFIKIDSEDEIGRNAEAFNKLVAVVSTALKTETALRTYTEMLTSQLDLNALTKQALDQLIQHTEAGAGSIIIETDGEIKVAASSGIRNPNLLTKSEVIQQVFQSKKRICILLPEDIVIEGVLTDFRPKEVIAEPVIYKNIPLGVIVLANSCGFSDDHRNGLNLFSQSLALALHNALVHEQLQRIAALDPLTNIYNRRFGMMRLHEEFTRSVRSNLPLGIMMLDIDHFKNINDTYGHIAGDKVISSLCGTVRLALREGDIMMRYGGEEFLAIIPGASRHDLHMVAERVRRMIEENTIHIGDQAISVTASIGITSYPEINAEDETGMIRSADEALYMAKDSGRNKVIIK